LGSVSVICLDKTGTITEGKMEAVGAVTDLTEKVEEQITDEGKHDKEKMGWIVRGALLCNDLRDPLEISMQGWAALRLEKRVGKNIIQNYKRVDEIPFDHKTKYIATRHEINDAKHKGEVVDFVSGAPEVVLGLSRFDKKAEKELWEERFRELGIDGYRLVAMAMKKRLHKKTSAKLTRLELKELDWLGLVIFSDPVRGGVTESLSEAQEAGIKIKVITGDYKETGWAAVHQVGLVPTNQVDSDVVMLGDDFKTLTGEQKRQKILRSVLFARTSPEQKFEIVEALKANGETVAMMGDGVNDVPALKRADIGIVVGSASDLAREVADLILLDNNFETILAAVEEGRGMFDNLRKVILFLLSDSFAAIVAVVISIYLKWPLPLLASQILWINLISDGFPYMALTVEPKEKGLLMRKPLRRNAPVLDWKRVALVAVISLTAGLLALAVFGLNYFYLGRDIVFSRTMAFAMQGISSLVYVFSSRSLAKPIWRDNLFKNPLLVLGVLAGLGLQIAAIYLPFLQNIFSTVPISVNDWLWLFGGGVLLILMVETIKMAYFRNGED
jgi:Ca2+-transporting ATPase